MSSTSEKTCTVCGETKPLSAFGKHTKTRDGRQEQCRPCRRRTRQMTDAAYRERNRERLRVYELAAQAQWRARNPDRYSQRKREFEERTTSETRAAATRHRQPWTQRELDVANQRELSATEVAYLIGRTRRSVTAMRLQLNREARNETTGEA